MERRIERTKVEQAVRVPSFLLLDCSPVVFFSFCSVMELTVSLCVSVCVCVPFYPVDRQIDDRQASEPGLFFFFFFFLLPERATEN
jgi:hypothetical protein